jgi:hypothetical protein
VGVGLSAGGGVGMELGFCVENVTRSPVDSGLQGQGSVADGFTDHIVALFSPHWQYFLGTLACFGAALVKRQCGVLAKLPSMLADLPVQTVRTFLLLSVSRHFAQVSSPYFLQRNVRLRFSGSRIRCCWKRLVYERLCFWVLGRIT